jgi:hypothetical protein
VTNVFSLTTVGTPNKGKRTFEFFILLLCELFKEKLEIVTTVVAVRAVVKEVAERSRCVFKSEDYFNVCRIKHKLWRPSMTVIIHVALIPLYNPWDGSMFLMSTQLL